MPKDETIIKFLESYNSLQLGGSPWPSFNPDEQDRRLIDWDTLFPRRRPGRGENELDVGNEQWTPDLDEYHQSFQEALEADEPSDRDVDGTTVGLEWDVCAWYQPIHFFGPNWGIFIRQDCVIKQAIEIVRFIPSRAYTPRQFLHLQTAAILASIYTYFLHEQYHHKVESLGLRLHVVDRKSSYLPYEYLVYRPAKGTDDQLEEALANADAFHRLSTQPYAAWITPSVVAATKKYLKRRFPHDPPGYRTATSYLTGAAFEAGENLLQARIHEATLKPSQTVSDWDIASRMLQSAFKVTDHLWSIVTPGRSSIFPTRP